MRELANPLPPSLSRLSRPAMTIGVACLLLCALGAIWQREQFFTSYLFAYQFVLGTALGSLALTMLHHLTGGGWGMAIRRPAEAAAMTLPLLVVLFLPLLLGVRNLYAWAIPSLVAQSSVLQHQTIFLNMPFWAARAAAYFSIWMLLAWLMWRSSSRYQAEPNARAARLIRLISAAGLVAYFFSMTFASVDWIMAREPGWFSTIIGLIVTIGQGLTAMVFLVVLLAWISKAGPVAGVLTPHVLIDLGNLILTLVILWAYMSFAQLLVIWMGNVAADTPWYISRGLGARPNGFKWVGLFLVVLHFFVPFVLLLIRKNKANLRFLTGLAGAVLLLRVIDTYWMTVPSSVRPVQRQGLHVNWMDVLMLMGLAGIWLSTFLYLLAMRPLLPEFEEQPANVLTSEGNTEPNGGGHVARFN